MHHVFRANKLVLIMLLILGYSTRYITGTCTAVVATDVDRSFALRRKLDHSTPAVIAVNLCKPYGLGQIRDDQ